MTMTDDRLMDAGLGYVPIHNVHRFVPTSHRPIRRDWTVQIRGVGAVKNRRLWMCSIFKFSTADSFKLEGKYSLESTDPRESEIRAPPQPPPYLMPIPPTCFFYNK